MSYPDWIKHLPLDLINDFSKKFQLDFDLIASMIMVESAGDPLACRYEAKWKYLYRPHTYAQELNITANTETILQSCSWGMMQVMGSVARELGFKGNLLLLVDADLGLEFGCRKLRTLITKYHDEEEAVASYNAGSPRKVSGMFVNQRYVDKVYLYLRELRGIK